MGAYPFLPCALLTIKLPVVLISAPVRSASAEEAGGDDVEEYVNDKFYYKIDHPS
jgi:hypothetical protein